MTLMLLGLGSSWLAVFGKIAEASVPILTVSAILISVDWGVALLRGMARQQKWLLVGVTVLTSVAWLVYLNEVEINTHLIEMM